MKKNSRMFLALLGLTTAMLMGINVYAEDADLTPGVTVIQDDNSPTGYTATFVYEDQMQRK